MKLFYANIGDKLTGSRLQRRRQSGIFARLLLGHALNTEYGIKKLPEIQEYPGGKPFFPLYSDIHFSLSHSGDFVLCAVGRAPLGCDIEKLRSISESLLERVLSKSELERFKADGSDESDFFALWSLKESAMKLSGDPSLSFRKLSFTLSPARMEDNSVLCRVYDGISGYSAAVCSLEEEPPEEITEAAL